MNNTGINVKHNQDFLTKISFHLPETILSILVFCMCCHCCCYYKDFKNIFFIRVSSIPNSRTFSSFEFLETQVVLTETNKNTHNNSSVVVVLDTDEENIPIANEIFPTSADVRAGHVAMVTA
jgi:hypothetical protein